LSALVVATPTEMNAMMAFARELAEANLLPRPYQRNPANVLYAIEYGRTIGVPAMTAILGIHVIEGKPTASAALISGLVRRAGHKLRVVADDKKLTVTATVVRADDPDFVFTSTWDMDRAKTAELLGKKVWKNYPLAMLKARAITEVARDACQEALFGLLYTPEELGATVDAEGNPIIASTGEIITGDVAVVLERPEVTGAMANAWANSIMSLPLAALKDLGLDINQFQGWSARTEVAGDATVREVLVIRLGEEIGAAETRGQLRPVFQLMRGFGLEKDSFTYTDGNEDVNVLLGDYCTAKGKALPETLAEPLTDNAQQMQAAAIASWDDDAKAVLTDAGLVVEGEIA
jgi:hypothetical protein